MLIQKEVVVSGIGLGPHGVSSLVEHLSACELLEVIAPSSTISLSVARTKGRLGYIKAIIKQVYIYLSFYLRLLPLIINGCNKITLIHHHSIGVVISLLLMLRAKEVNYFAVDSSFFCIKSYNQVAGRECIDCVQAPAPRDGCVPFPSYSKRWLHLIWFGWAEKLLTGNKILCQTELQANLARVRFPNSEVTVVGLMTSDIQAEIYRRSLSSPYVPRRIANYFVFHGSCHQAKGFTRLLESPFLVRERILFPFSRSEAEKALSSCGLETTVIPGTWEFQVMDWKSGLREECLSCKAVLCPSVWSAPIEAALIKSMCVNPNVIVLTTDYGFSSGLDDLLVWKVDERNVEAVLAEVRGQTIDKRNERWLAIDEYLNDLRLKSGIGAAWLDQDSRRET